jgi:hypothetical protein
VARGEGAAAERETINVRVKGALPILQSAEYPEVIKNMAISVIAGEQELAALIGAAAGFDAFKAGEETLAAVEDSVEQPVVAPAVVAKASNDGVIRSGEDLDAEIRALRGEVE